MFPVASPDSSLVVFFHGGYRQELSKEDSSFPAAGFIEQNISFCAVNYELAPRASIGDIVRQCARSVEWLHSQGSSLGFDPTRIVLAGSSAGAHLAAMTAMLLQRGAHARSLVRGTVLASGIFDLTPLVHTSINTPSA
ncbi:alpha/beta hydrolase [Paraburkholderia sp. IW21]|uniref:alpha/beta hydrolase n=1 Tax=Paraburkholderia sp. IW21 TaxID=3242488 RepID=UPI003520F463